MISVVIPNYNGEKTIGPCLESVFASDCGPCEVTVVDDGSSDGSVGIIRKYPCRLLRLPHRSGASRARNVGAAQSRGDVLFFTDADCVVGKDTLRQVVAAIRARGARTVVGGTYSARPADRGFYGFFQSVFINYHETKNLDSPDYVATHAMAVTRKTFRESGGFREDFLPIIEDVEFSHRVRRAGSTLIVEPGIEVAHIFNFNLRTSLKNAFRKAAWWAVYSLRRGDLLADSGTASRGLKANVVLVTLSLAAVAASVRYGLPWAAALLPALAVNVGMNHGLFQAFFREGGIWFGLRATGYYLSLYPLAVAAGALSGLLRWAGMKLRPMEGPPWGLQPSGTQDR